MSRCEPTHTVSFTRVWKLHSVCANGGTGVYYMWLNITCDFACYIPASNPAVRYAPIVANSLWKRIHMLMGTLTSLLILHHRDTRIARNGARNKLIGIKLKPYFFRNKLSNIPLSLFALGLYPRIFYIFCLLVWNALNLFSKSRAQTETTH